MPSFVLTGAANGIGHALAKTLLEDHGVGWSGTLLDLQPMEEQSMNFSNFIQGDVTSAEDNDRAFASHVERFGSPSAVVLNAGVGEVGNGEFPDMRCLNVNLIGVMHGIRSAIQHGMERGGTIVVVASAGGLWPMTYSPTYSTAKAAVVMLTRSLAPSVWKKHRVRLWAVCPQFVNTQLGLAGARFQREVTGMLDVSTVATTIADLVQSACSERADGPKPGDIYAIMSQGNFLVRRVLLDVVKTVPVLMLPRTFRKVIITEETHLFRRAAQLVDVPMANLEVETAAGKVIVKNLFCGINASDVNFSAGKYGMHPPMDAGFEGCGVVARDDSGTYSVGQPLCYLHYGSFAEYVALAPSRAFKVHRACPEVVALLTSGLTASIALEQASAVKPGDVVLITAAAGGTGQFFVQLAKEMGAFVIATCGSAEKATILKRLGADVCIDYRREDVKHVLQSRFSKGVDVVIELVGGDMFDVCLKALKPGGRLVIIGAMSQYSSGWKPKPYPGIVERLLAKNQSLIGFFLLNYSKLFKRHFELLESKWRAGKLAVQLSEPVAGGIDAIFDAVDYLQAGSSSGKVTLSLYSPNSKPTLSATSTHSTTEASSKPESKL